MLHLKKANRMADVIFQAARHFHLPCKIVVRRLNRNLKKNHIKKYTFTKGSWKTKIFHPLIRNVRMHIRG